MLGLCLLLGFISCTPHKEKVRVYPNSFYEENKIQTKQNIDALRDGLLLVRLDDKKNKIDYLLKSNQTNKAQELRNETSSFNDSIKSYFESYYNFSAVAFYHLSDSDAILKEKKYDLIQFTGKEKSKDVNNDQLFFCIMGDHPNSEMRPLEGYTVMKKSSKDGRSVLELIEAPFPSFAKVKNVKKLLSLKKQWDTGVITLNINLKECFKKYGTF